MSSDQIAHESGGICDLSPHEFGVFFPTYLFYFIFRFFKMDLGSVGLAIKLMFFVCPKIEYPKIFKAKDFFRKKKKKKTAGNECERFSFEVYIIIIIVSSFMTHHYIPYFILIFLYIYICKSQAPKASLSNKK